MNKKLKLIKEECLGKFENIKENANGCSISFSLIDQIFAYEEEKCITAFFIPLSGIDSTGESVHGSMYQHLWINVMKEASMEYPDYTFLDHYGGKPVPSYLPREAIREYLEGKKKNG